jgi:hypothetical protein
VGLGLGACGCPRSILKIFVSLKYGISRILGVILSKCSYKHVFNGVLTTLNFYFLADPNWEIATWGRLFKGRLVLTQG